MKFFLFSFFFSTFAFGNSLLDCDKLNALEIPNCSNEEFSLTAAGTKEVPGDITALCNCKNTFYEKIALYPGLQVSKPKINLKNDLFNELKKSIAANLLDMTSLRSIYTSPGDYSKLGEKCDLSIIDSAKCLSDDEKKQFKSQIAGELGKLLNTSTQYEDSGILKRKSSLPETCSAEVTDADVLRTNSSVIEMFLTSDIANPSAIEKLASLSPVTSEKLKALLTELDLLTNFENHPLYSTLMTNPQDLKTFFGSLSKPVSSSTFSSQLFNNRANTQKMIDSIAGRCESSLKGFTSNICSDAIKNNRAQIRNFPIPNPLSAVISRSVMPSIETDNPDQAQSVMNRNADMLRICDLQNQPKTAPDLNAILNSISGWLPSGQAASNINSFGQQRYESQIGTNRVKLCKILALNPGNDCLPSLAKRDCLLLQAYRKSKDPKQPENVLATTSDSNLNAILRSMIGNPKAKDLNPETARVLIAQGIIPATEGGEVVKTDTTPRTVEAVASQTNGGSSRSAAAATRTATRTAATTGARPQSSATAAATQYDLPTDSSISDGSASQLTDSIAQNIRDQQGSSSLRAAADDIVASSVAKKAAAGTARAATRVQPQADLPAATAVAATTTASSAVVSAPGALTPGATSNPRGLDNVQDPRAIRANRQMQAALEAMAAKNTVGGGAGAGLSGAGTREPASVAKAGDGTISLNVDPNGDVSAALAELLKSSDNPTAMDIRAKIAGLQNFRIKLNGSPVDFIFKDGQYSMVAPAGSRIDQGLETKVEQFLKSLVDRSALVNLNSALQQATN